MLELLEIPLLKVKRVEGRGVETQNLLDYAGHRLTQCNVSLMIVEGHVPKHGTDA